MARTARTGSSTLPRPARPEPLLRVTTTRVAGRPRPDGRLRVTQLLHIEGELTVRTRNHCRLRLRQHLRHAPDRLVVDLRGADPVDVVGIAVVVRLARAVRSMGGEVVVVNAGHRAERAITLLGSEGLLRREH